MKKAGYLSIAGAVLLVDQMSKYAIVHGPVAKRPVIVIPGFLNLVYAENTGAVFGLFDGLSGNARILVLLVVPLVTILLVTFLMKVSGDHERLALVALALVLGGALGNQADRLLRSGKVVDFLDTCIDVEPLRSWLVRNLGSSHWYTFNVADTAIVVGALLLALALLRKSPRAGAPAPKTGAPHGRRRRPG